MLVVLVGLQGREHLELDKRCPSREDESHLKWGWGNRGNFYDFEGMIGMEAVVRDIHRMAIAVK
jgi:hypothetical protein